MSVNLEQFQAVVSGRVQGVSFRWATSNEARALGLVGWVRNLADGSVELLAEGPAEQLAKLEKWCHRGPTAAAVTAVKVSRKKIEQLGFDTFEIRR